MSAARSRKRTARTWKQDPDGRRALVLAATEQEIVERGIHGLRTSAVARRAGVAEGTIFSLFGSKDGVLAEVGRRWGEGMVAAAFGDVLLDPEEPDIDAFVNNVFDYARKGRGLLEAFFRTSDALASRTVVDAVRRQIVAAIEQALHVRMTREDLPFEDARVAAALQFGLVEGALRHCFVRNQGAGEAACRREVANSLRALLKLPQPAASAARSGAGASKRRRSPRPS